MRYMLLIHSDESFYATVTDQQMGELMGGYMKLDTDLRAAGAYVDSYRLKPSATATTVRVRNGDTTATDGPYAETKEQFGGYYLIDVPDLDAAMKWATQIPTATYGSVEIRPVWTEDE